MDYATTLVRDAVVEPSMADGRRIDAVAIDARGILRAAGGLDDVRPLHGPNTNVISIGGATLLPGFLDAHIHPVLAGLEQGQVDLSDVWGIDSYRVEIDRYAAENPTLEWVTGEGWSMETFDRGVPKAKQLVGLGDGRPIYLPNRDHHSAWVNEVALRRAGVDRHTPDPIDGRIERDANGDPTGTLHDGAMSLVADLPLIAMDRPVERKASSSGAALPTATARPRPNRVRWKLRCRVFLLTRSVFG